MKKIFTFLLAAVFAVSALVAEIPNEEITTVNFDPDQITHLDINFAAGNVKIQNAVRNDILVTITREYDAPSVSTKIEKGTLSIKTKILSSYKKKIDIVVEIPFGKNLGQTKVTCVSANTTIKGINTKELFITTATGKVNIENCRLPGNIKIGGASGKISMKDSLPDYLSISAVNGEIELTDITSKLVKTEVAGGKIITHSLKTEAFEAQSMNGMIEMDFEEMISKDSWVKTSGGSIGLTFPTGKGYKAVVSSLNGQFVDNNTYVTASACENLVSSYKEGEPEIKINTKSGKITISSR
ncbi:MAG: DUF4097 domain-containing protein [Treponema sp.]|nr:DUF4097 domain-containing protein [Treponema sp.]